VKIVHAADLHLDSPLVGLRAYEGAPDDRIRGATRVALGNLVALCLDEGAQLLLIAGDLFDGDWRDYSTGLYFQDQMSRLREAGVRVVWLRGNHDAANRMSRYLRPPENVRELGVNAPETIEIPELGVAVHGQGFAKRDETRNLVADYPRPLPGAFNVGLLHTALDGRDGHDPYAPCRLGELLDLGYDYWALGHVHATEILHRDPWVAFSGNLQGRHARETGPKGALLVCVDGARVTSVEHRALDHVRWVRCDVDATKSASADDVMERVRRELEAAVTRAEGRLVAARVTVTGATAAHDALLRDPERYTNEIRALAMDCAGGDVWVEKVRLATRTALDLRALAARDDAVGELVKGFSELRGDPEALALLGTELSELWKKLGDLAHQSDVLGPEPERLTRLLTEAEQLVVPRLLEDEETP
jgi:DNA repair exonuclease SbcCD nuclease subunit